MVDEAAAIYFGTGCPAGSLASVADKRAQKFGTLTAAPDGTCTAAANVAVAEALKKLQAAAKAGDTAAYSAAARDLDKAVVVIFTQVGGGRKPHGGARGSCAPAGAPPAGRRRCGGAAAP